MQWDDCFFDCSSGGLSIGEPYKAIIYYYPFLQDRKQVGWVNTLFS